MSLPISLLALALAAAPARVAVLPFDNATTDAELEAVRGGLADLVASDLSAADSLVVVERARFADVAKELELQRTKYFDPKQTVRVGQALGATHLESASPGRADPPRQREWPPPATSSPARAARGAPACHPPRAPH